MSSEATTWVMRTATRKVPAHLLSTLHVLADRANEYGRNAWLQYKDSHRSPGRPRATQRPHQCRYGLCEEGLATRTGVTIRQAKRRVADLERLGFIRRGDQELLANRHPSYRPVVWDIPGVVEDLVARSGGLVSRRDV